MNVDSPECERALGRAPRKGLMDFTSPFLFCLECNGIAVGTMHIMKYIKGGKINDRFA